MRIWVSTFSTTGKTNGHTNVEVFQVLQGLCKIFTILNLECCKCARMRFHCRNGLAVLRICVVAHLRGNTDHELGVLNVCWIHTNVCWTHTCQRAVCTVSAPCAPREQHCVTDFACRACSFGALQFNFQLLCFHTISWLRWKHVTFVSVVLQKNF